MFYPHSHSVVHFFCDDDWRLELCTSWILRTMIIMTKIGKRKGSMRYDLGSPKNIYIYHSEKPGYSGNVTLKSMSHSILALAKGYMHDQIMLITMQDYL